MYGWLDELKTIKRCGKKKNKEEKKERKNKMEHFFWINNGDSY